MPEYSDEPRDRKEFTGALDAYYTRFAHLYDLGIKLFPIWKGWLRHAIPYLKGPRVLEVSFGTGYLLTRYAGRFETHGIDYNKRMVEIAQKNLNGAGITADLRQGNVEWLPYADESFDSVLNTMAFSGYPDPIRALSEMTRVLKKDGSLILIYVNYPADGNWPGTRMADCWKYLGDVILDMGGLFRQFSLAYMDEEIGGYGSVHLYVATKQSGSLNPAEKP